MTTIETKFRSLSKLAAECQRQVERLYHVDSITVQQEVTDLIRSSIRCLEQDIEVSSNCRPSNNATIVVIEHCIRLLDN